jgi:hypothetical protein
MPIAAAQSTSPPVDGLGRSQPVADSLSGPVQRVTVNAARFETGAAMASMAWVKQNRTPEERARPETPARTAEQPVFPRAVAVPGLISGRVGIRPEPAEGRLDEPADVGTDRPGTALPRSVPPSPIVSVGRVNRQFVRRNGPSEKALADLATPIVRAGPTIEVQAKLVDLIESTIPMLSKERTAALTDLDRWSDTFDVKKATKEDSEKHSQDLDRRFQEINKQFPEMDLQEIYLGSIVLDGIAPVEKEGALVNTRLQPTDNALSTLANGFKLVEKSKAEPLIVENTVATMISSGQIDYLRKAGSPGRVGGSSSRSTTSAIAQPPPPACTRTPSARRCSSTSTTRTRRRCPDRSSS